MKVKKGFMLREVADSYVVVAVGKASEEFHGIINLNKVASFLWKSLEKDIEEDELVKKLMLEYDVDINVAKEDVHIFINKLKEHNLLD